MTKRPALPNPPHTGGCLCGAVRYSYAARPLALSACHCSDCKKLSGATHSEVLIGDRAAFSYSGEVERYRKRAKSGREIDIVRCAQCGTRSWHEPVAAPNLVFIQAGGLDDSSWFVPVGHIWVELAAPGQYFAEDAVRIEGQPTDRQVIFDALNRIYPAK